MKKLSGFLLSTILLYGCASSGADVSASSTSVYNASVESVSKSGAVLKTDDDGKSRNITVSNDDQVVVIRERKTISPASLIPGEHVEITYSNGSVSTICVRGSE